MSEINKVIESEIADFFAGFGGPGEPDIQSGEAQRLLTERVLSALALRERAVPVAYADPHAFRNFQAGTAKKEWMWAKSDSGLVPLYATPPAQPVAVPECFLNAVSALESLYRNGQKQCWHERYTTDMAYASGVLNACLAAMLAAPGKEG